MDWLKSHVSEMLCRQCWDNRIFNRLQWLSSVHPVTCKSEHDGKACYGLVHLHCYLDAQNPDYHFLQTVCDKCGKQHLHIEWRKLTQVEADKIIQEQNYAT